ncbi:MAG: hypothetical protein GWN73_01290, partial [Actinobacteria bacterium]|nr:hypothetical protein [Actinomycetota bacterium]NIU64138.1 hypothetical protein [Actinomycetota bacterium]NIW25939.1 hypothetical protein [Actinomycetota bacterium]
AGAAVIAFEGRRVVVSARRPEAAAALIEGASSDAATVDWGVPVTGAVVVNATPLGMQGERLPGPVLDAAAGLIDLVYGAE